MAKILCVLYDDPVSGYPDVYAREGLPMLAHYPDGMSLPTPSGYDFKPGHLLGSVTGELGLRKFLENLGHTFIVTSDKDGPQSRFEQELINADIIISQPFWPAYLTKERIAKAKQLKLAITAGIGSDHVDLEAAIQHNLTVAEVTYSNSISVAEQNVMLVLSLLRNYLSSYDHVLKQEWHIADCAMRAYDLEGMTVGVVGAGRIGLATMKRLKPFDVKLNYTDRYRLSHEIENELSLTYHDSIERMVATCDIIILCCPLHSETEHMIDDVLLAKMKRGTYLINTARGKLCDRDAIVRALQSGQLAGYAGDVWFPQPATKDHPWRTMPHHGMTPHVSGTTLSAQMRYASGVREILESWFAGKPIRQEYLIVDNKKLAGMGAHSYSSGKMISESENLCNS